MPIGVFLLVGIGALIFFGIAQRVLDRLHLSDKAAVIFIIAIILGSFVDIPISSSPKVVLNLGGGVVPIILAIYVLSKAGTKREWIRALASTLITSVAIYLAARYLFFNAGHTNNDIVDPQYVFALLGGIVAYIAGRSRRSAFIAGVLGFLVYNLFTLFVNVYYRNLNSTLTIGGAGIFDTMIISGIIAVLLAEIVGEIRERLGGGPIKGDNRPRGLRNPEMANFLGKTPDDRRRNFQVKKGGKKDD